MRIQYLVIPIVTALTAVSGSWLTSGGMSWYRTIKLPSWTPPGSVIGMVWTTLFVLATVSALLVWNAPRTESFSVILWAFIINAVLNVGWSLVFFNRHLIGAGIFSAAILGLSVVALIVLIRPVSILAAWLLVPYAAWVFFATYLNYQIWKLN